MGEIYSRPHETQEALVDYLKEHHLKSDRIEKAFRMVDRANFMPLSERVNAYYDTAWRFEELHMSAPSIYATVVTHLDPQSGQSFLNLGSGTGYLSCIVGLLIGPNGTNHGVEVKTPVISYARKMVEEFRRTSPEAYYSSFSVPEFFDGNFFTICPSSRQYDLIYCGAGITDTEEYKSLCKLLKVNGRFIVPYLDTLLLVTMKPDREVKTEVLMSVAFSRAIHLQSGSSSPYIVLPYSSPSTLFRSCLRTVQRCITVCMLEERGWPGNRIVRYRRRPTGWNRNNSSSDNDRGDDDGGSDGGGGGAGARTLFRTENDSGNEGDGSARTRGSDEGEGDANSRRETNDMQRLYFFLRGLHAQNVAASLSGARDSFVNLSMGVHRIPMEEEAQHRQNMAMVPVPSQRELFHEFFGSSSSASSSSSNEHGGRCGRRSRPNSGEDANEKEGASTNKKIRTTSERNDTEEEGKDDDDDGEEEEVRDNVRLNVGVDLSSGHISVARVEESSNPPSLPSLSSPSTTSSSPSPSVEPENTGNPEEKRDRKTSDDESFSVTNGKDKLEERKMDVDENAAKISAENSDDEVKIVSETESDAFSGSTEGADNLDGYVNQEVSEEVLVERTYNSFQELQMRIEKLPLPIFLKEFLIESSSD